MPRALTENDATVLKLTMFALLERYSTMDRFDLNEINSRTPTPSGPADEIMDAINRVRIDGKAVVRTERTTSKGKTFYDLHYPFTETDFPGGPRTVCLALSCACTNWSACRCPTTSATDPPRRASTRRRSNAWPHPSRSSSPPNPCTDRAPRAGRRNSHTPSCRQPAPSTTRPPRTHRADHCPPSRTLPGMIPRTPSRAAGDPHRARRARPARTEQAAAHRAVRCPA